MTTLNNKIDFAIIINVKNANPNGDPLSGNRPRTTSDGLGEMSDVCLKRKLRNRLMSSGENVFVQSDEMVLDGCKSLSDRFNGFLSSLSPAERKEREVIARKVCENWIDVRGFGQVFAYKKKGEVDEVSLGIRGPVTIQSAFSVEPVNVESIQITKSVNSETTKDGGKSADTMGMKHRISSAVYVSFGSISPQLAEKTGFSNEDAIAIKKALTTLFENDESSARPSGSMEVLTVLWWEHDSKSGQYSSAKVHRSVKINPDGSYSLENLANLMPEELSY